MNELAELHKERQAVAALLGLLPGDRIPVGGTVLQDRARAILRRDWAVRVLDAWAGNPYNGTYTHARRVSVLPVIAGSGWFCYLQIGVGAAVCRADKFSAPTADAARHAAALAVLPTLPAEKRAELGECP